MEDQGVENSKEANKKESNIIFVPPEMNKINSDPLLVSFHSLKSIIGKGNGKSKI